MSGQPARLSAPSGAFIDRSRPLTFTFDGRDYEAFAGDTVASALAANRIKLISRSFKYHRPRGIFSLASCEANTLVEVNGAPNIFAERHLLSDGDRVRGQNYSGSLAHDCNAWIGAFGRFLPVGFYYHAFFRPRGAWRLWEPILRRIAGLGQVDVNAAHGYYDKAYLFADVAVIGGGPAGLSAALAASQEGARVLIVDDQPVLGGSLNYTRCDAAGMRAQAERNALAAKVAGTARITVMTGASCEGVFADRWLAIVRGRRLYKLRADRAVLATGALEQPAVFRNNDLPGIMLGSAAQRLIKAYGVRPGKSAVVLTANDFGYGVTLDLADAGVNVAAVIDVRGYIKASALRSAVAARTIRIEAGTMVSEALGRAHLHAVRIGRVQPNAGYAAPFAAIDCDLLCVSTGFAPNLALAAQGGARLVYDQRTAMYRPQDLPQGVTVAGAANQRFELGAVIADGERAGRAIAAGEPGESALSATHPLPICMHPRGKEFVDFDEDLTVRDIKDTIASGFDDIQLLKRYSTAGMGPSQGKHSAVNTVRIAALARGENESLIGTTTFRPPYCGESFGVLAGRSFDPVRRTPMHHRHVEAGAQMMVAGAWLRPAYYGDPAEAEQAVANEVAAVRGRAGLIDVSTLGKIEIRGPDAAEFVDRIYFTPHRKQPVNRTRYAVMTDATGAITDDGIVCRLSERHFFVTATTSGVDAAVRAMYLWNAHWQLDVDIAHVTAAYAAVNLAGPQSRAILALLCSDVDLASAAFPYMGVRTGHMAGVPARLLRVGFVGELGFEIHIPAGCGEFVWDRILEAGRASGLKPFGVEAQRLLRLEKGHIIVGQDTDGLTHPLEVGMRWNAAAKPFFIGSAALAAHQQRGIERILVGFELDAVSARPKECHLVIERNEIAGRVTSCAYSAALGRAIGLAYVRPHQSEPGQTFSIRVDGGKLVRARVVTLPFYDPGNARQNA
ncbi:MAG TPA: 2Fe-2S iron-sulfur cluster-binding protein [Xanthobacteraceae bacterium]